MPRVTYVVCHVSI